MFKLLNSLAFRLFFPQSISFSAYVKCNTHASEQIILGHALGK